MLHRLVTNMSPKQFKPLIISLQNGGKVTSKLKDEGIKVISLNMHSSVIALGKILELRKILRTTNPDIVQTWMYHADFVGGVAAKLAGNLPVIWGIRNSTLDPKFSNPSTIRLVSLNAKLASYLATVIVSNSSSAGNVHVKLGYPEEKFRIIHNGINLDEFFPDKNAYLSLRKELKISESTPVIGLIGRFDPQKNQNTFIKAASILTQMHSDVNFLMAGSGIEWKNPGLSEQINLAGLAPKFHLLGPREDVPRIMAGLDILASVSTYGESFPNVVAEAMACGVPCVVTDVGDSAHIVDESGIVVPVNDPFAVAEAWASFLKMGKKKKLALSTAARNRIKTHFGISKMVKAYTELYHDLRK